jgi:hypothetical protein
MLVSGKASALAPFVAWTALLAGCGEGVMGKQRDAGGNGSGDGSSGTCTPNAGLRCEGNTLVSCNADATGESQTACSLRCNATSLACENKVAPSNGYSAQLDAAASEPALNITANTSVILTTNYDPNSGKLMVGSQAVTATVVPGANGGPEVLVLSVNSLSVAANVTWTIQNESGSPRQVAIMSASDVSIAGTIRRGGTGAYPASDLCNAPAANAFGADNDSPGGGGGGFGTAGGAGGGILTIAAGGAAGTAAGDATLVPLRPGCKGGNTAGLGGGGGGGGAVQITSGTSIAIAGMVTSPGFGGTVNAGGGSGGAILLEAPVVTITGGVFANGGAGGCGGITDQGNPGTNTTSPTVGGPCPNTNYSAGNGGAGTTPPTEGTTLANASGQQQNAPGGGGAVGRIRINTLAMTVAGAGAQSPPASLGPVGTR